MKRKRKWLLWTGVLALGLSLYPLFVLGFTYAHVFRSDLEGGRHGPLDAYRHALASSIVSYTLGESAVQVFTDFSESDEGDSHQMDRHNNRIGAKAGAEATSLCGLEPAVRQLVSKGTVNATDPDQITWLPEKKWSEGRFW